MTYNMNEPTILRDSISPIGARITTVLFTIPKYTQAELKTHGRQRGNAASSRAIPIAKQLEALQKAPVVPIFGKNEKGMVSTEPLDEAAQEEAKRIWLWARDMMMTATEQLKTVGVHKQWANRLIEPWMWSTNILTATEDAWNHFFRLRTAPDAQPEFRDAARQLFNTYSDSDPKPIAAGEWVRPYVSTVDIQEVWETHEDYLSRISPNERQATVDRLLNLISAARCARLSYANHGDKNTDIQKDIATATKLAQNGHLTPFEHQYTPASRWTTSPRTRDTQYVPAYGMNVMESAYGCYGPYRGWISARTVNPEEFRPGFESEKFDV